MGSFSIVHWLVVLLVAFLWVFPIWKILERTGRPGPLALIALVPMLGLVLLWWIALSRWPAQERSAGTTPAPRS